MGVFTLSRGPDDAKVWGAAARSVWGKTDKLLVASLSLVQHLEDAAGVAGLLWDTWVPFIVRQRLAEAVGDDASARTLTVFLAGTHDIGKATPAFAQLANDVGMSHLVSAMTREGLDSPLLPRTQRERHTLTGHVALSGWLRRRFGWTEWRSETLASIVSSHHGTPASDADEVQRVERDGRSMGGDAWATVRDEILDGMCERTGASQVLDHLRDVKLRLPHLVDLCALVVMADWIASDTSRFPYERGVDTAHQLAEAAETLDLRPPWEPRDLGDAFATAFPHLTGATPTALQREALASARSAAPGSLLVIEAPTGSGKSEAALMAAEAMAVKAGAGGVFVALPTMATSNAMFSRVLDWVEAWPDREDPTLWLAHGKAGLNDDFRGLIRESRVVGVHDDETFKDGGSAARSSVRVSSWFSGRRKGLLANVVVGTVDQVLLGALQARHLALRHLALSSKVVIVDEVHATDVYMRSYLQRMLTYLGAYGTPVLLLSATLPATQRMELAQAYQEGKKAMAAPAAGGLRARTSPAVATTATETPTAAVEVPHYPLLTLVGDTTQQVAVPQDQRSRYVRLEPLDDGLDTLLARLRRLTVDGGCIAIIRNTVRRAQETYDALREVFGDDVVLFHSRFIDIDRAQRERHLVDLLGPRGQRPQRLIVVGTQVLEQSLDLDVDLMVTDLAPIDLLIQRCGRLHRHQRALEDRPECMRAASCLVTGVEDWSAGVPRAVPVSRRVYAESLLLGAAAVLRPYLSGAQLSLPEDVPRLVAEAFDPALPPPEGWEEAWGEAQRRLTSSEEASRSKAGVFRVDPPTQAVALTGWVRTPAQEDREETQARAQVRDSDDGIEVIMVVRDGHGVLRVPPGSFRDAGAEIPSQPLDHQPITRVLAGCTVSLPQSLTNPRAWDATVEALEADPVADEWQGSKWLAGQLVVVLDDSGDGTPASTELNGHDVTYDATRGLTVTRIEPKADS